MKKATLLILSALVFLAGIGIGFLLSPKQPLSLNNNNCTEKYTFINPLLGCGVKYVISKRGYMDAKAKIEKYIDDKVTHGDATQVSVYFRDLVNGPWLGIGQDEEFSPASLLKLPVMLSYFKLAEDDPNLLSRTLIITKLPKEEEQFYKPSKTLEVGKSYSLEELIERAITYSDNSASSVLVERLFELSSEKDPLTQTLRETGNLYSESKPGDALTVKSYASLFRILYHGSYLSNEMSEKTLEILSRAEFKDGIAGGVPGGVRIARKFGERNINSAGVRQLHDCGIVYFPGNPYLICVMSRGKDFNTLSNIIQEISRMVWEEVDSRKIP